MTLNDLRYIVTLAQEQHFGRAAERCFVSQPTLSIAVKKLEEELDVHLFERSKTRVQPTPTGEKIIAQAQLVLEQAAAIKDLAKSGRDQLNSPLRVGAIFTIGPYLLPNFIPALQEVAPDMPLFVEENYTASLRQRLRKGDLDAIIVALPFTEPDVVTQPLYEEPFVVLMPEQHPLSEKVVVSAEDLYQHNVLLLGQGHCFRDQVLASYPGLAEGKERKQNNLHTAADGSTLETLRHMVASGLGVTVLPQSATGASHYRPGVLCTRPLAQGGDVPVSTPKRTVALAWRASFPRTKAIDALREAILQCRTTLQVD